MDKERVHGLRVLTSVPEDLISVPSTPLGWLTMVCNSNTKGSGALFWPRRWSHILGIHTQTHLQYINKIK